MKWLAAVAAGLAVTALAIAARASGGLPALLRRSRVYVRNRTLYGPDGVTMPLTDEDLLWLGRAIGGETGGEDRRAGAAVAWALAQNLMLVIGAGGRRPRYDSYTAMVRAYCQPVNPLWATAGQGKCAERPADCSEAALIRRRRWTGMSWEALPVVARQVAVDFAAGTLENPVGGMTDWAARQYDGAQVNIGGNWFGVSPSRHLAS